MSNLEDKLAFHIRAIKLPKPVQQYKFHPTRRWKADFCWVEEKLIVEVQGGIWASHNGTKSGHTTGQGILRDCEKMNEAVLLGYKYLKVCKENIDSGQAIEWIRKAINL